MNASGHGVEATFRFLRPDEGAVLSEAIRAAYGETYDVRWVYDADEVSARLAAGTYVSCVAESPEGELLCHEGMSLAAAGDAVAHSGQAATMPAARGQHLFTRTKRFLMDWARDQGLAGMYSEATAAHPYSQRANLELGAHETGFLLGWIPASVSNNAAADQRPKRQSAALFYAKLNDGHQRQVYAAPRHQEIVGRTLELCELRGTLAEPPAELELPERTDIHVAIEADHTIETKSYPGHLRVEKIDPKMLKQAYAQKKLLERITGLQSAAVARLQRCMADWPSARSPRGRGHPSGPDAAQLHCPPIAGRPP